MTIRIVGGRLGGAPHKAPCRIALALLVCTVLGGCATLQSGGAPKPPFDVDKDLQQLAIQFADSVQIPTFYKAPSVEARNLFIAGRLAQYNLAYVQFIRALGADKQQLDAASDLLVLALNLAGTIAGGEQTKTVLAALAAAVTGGKTVIDKDYFYEKTVPALISTMNAQRKQVMLRLITGTKLSLEEYSFTEAISDLHDYYFAGTLQGAIIAIQVDSGTKEKEADAEIRRLSRVTTTHIADRDRVHRTLIQLIASKNEVAITALLSALNLPTDGDLTGKSARLEAAHRAIRSPDDVASMKTAIGKASITLVD